MQVQKLNIQGIPSILWGNDDSKMKSADGSKLILAVHGKRSSKIDDCIWILAEEAVSLGYQVLSFDLPKHGERVYEPEPGRVEKYVKELKIMMKEAKRRSNQIYLFGCSMGAYFSLLSFQEEPIQYAWFLSPVTDMERMIRRLMEQHGIDEDRLFRERRIETSEETLYWDYYSYVKDHPIDEWSHPTAILRGEHDTLCERNAVLAFANRYHCELEEEKGGGHWFHTAEQLAYYREWIRNKL